MGLGTVATDVIAQEALARLIQNLAFIKNINTNFTQVGLAKGKSVFTHIITEMEAQDWDTAYTNAGELQAAAQSDVEIPLDKHKHVTFQLTDAQRDASQIELYGRFADVAAYALSKGIVEALIGEDTIGADAASLSNEIDVAGAGLTMSTIIDLGAQMDSAGIPEGSRWLVAHPTVLADLEKDVTEVTNASFDVGGTILNGGVSRIRGFDIYSYNGGELVTTDDKIGAVAGYSETLCLVTAPPSTPPNASGASLGYVGDADSGLTIQKREWYDADKAVYNLALTLYLGTKLSAGARGWKIKN